MNSFLACRYRTGHDARHGGVRPDQVAEAAVRHAAVDVGSISSGGSGLAVPTLGAARKTRQYGVEVRKRICVAPRINPFAIYFRGVLCRRRGLV